MGALAQQVKAKFPGQYDDIDDETLEAKIKANPVAMVKFQEAMKADEAKAEAERQEGFVGNKIMAGAGAISSWPGVISDVLLSGGKNLKVDPNAPLLSGGVTLKKDIGHQAQELVQRAGAAAGSGDLGVLVPESGAIPGQEEHVVKAMERKHPVLAGAESVAKPLGRAGVQFYTDPLIKIMGAGGAAKTLAPRVAAGVAGAAFIPGMVEGAATKAMEAHEKFGEGDWTAGLEAGTEALTDAAFAALGTKHAAAGVKSVASGRGSKPVATEGTPDPAVAGTGMRRETFGSPADLPASLRGGGAVGQDVRGQAGRAAGSVIGGLGGHVIGAATHIPGMNFILRQVGSRLGGNLGATLSARDLAARRKAGIDPFAKETPLHESEIANVTSILDQLAERPSAEEALAAKAGVQPRPKEDPLAGLQDYEIERAVQELAPAEAAAPPPADPIAAAKAEHQRLALENKMRAERMRARELDAQEAEIARVDALRAEHPQLPDLVASLTPPKGPLAYDKALEQARKALGIEAPQAPMTDEQAAAQIAANDPFQSAPNLSLAETNAALRAMPEPAEPAQRMFTPEDQAQLLGMLSPEVTERYQPLPAEPPAAPPAEVAQPAAPPATAPMPERQMAPEGAKPRVRKDDGISDAEKLSHPVFEQVMAEFEAGTLKSSNGQVIPAGNDAQARAIARSMAAKAIRMEREAAAAQEAVTAPSGPKAEQAWQQIDAVVEKLKGNVGAIRAYATKLGVTPEMIEQLLPAALERYKAKKPAAAPKEAAPKAQPESIEGALAGMVRPNLKETGELAGRVLSENLSEGDQSRGLKTLPADVLRKLRGDVEKAVAKETDPIDSARLQEDLRQVDEAIATAPETAPKPAEKSPWKGANVKVQAEKKAAKTPEKAPVEAVAAPEKAAAKVETPEAAPAQERAPGAKRTAEEIAEIKGLLDKGDYENAAKRARETTSTPADRVSEDGHKVGYVYENGSMIVGIDADGMVSKLKPSPKSASESRYRPGTKKQYSIEGDMQNLSLRGPKSADRELLRLMTAGQKKDTSGVPREEFPGVRRLKPGQTGPGVVEWTPRDPSTKKVFPEGELTEAEANELAIKQVRADQPISKADRSFSAEEFGEGGTLPGGFEIKPGRGKATLTGPNGEAMTVRLSDGGKTVEIWKINKGDADNSATMMNAARELADAHGAERIVFPTPRSGNMETSVTKAAYEMFDRLEARGEGKWKDGNFELNLAAPPDSTPPPRFSTKTIKKLLPESLAKKMYVDATDGSYVIDTPRGSIRIVPRDRIEIDYDTLGKSYSKAEVEAAKAGKLAIAGESTVLDGDALINIVKKGALPHEVAHVFLDHFATGKERAVLEKKLNAIAERSGKAVDEVIADAFRDYFNKKQADPGWQPKGAVGQFIKKVYDFFQGAYRAVNPNAESVFEKVRTGEAFDRTATRNADNGMVPPGKWAPGKGDRENVTRYSPEGPRGAGSALGSMLKTAEGLRKPRPGVKGVLETQKTDLTPRLVKGNPIASAETSKRSVENKSTVATPGAVAPKRYDVTTVDETMADVRKYNAKAKVFTEEQVNKYERDLKSVAAAVHGSIGELGFESIKGASALKANSDPRYAKSLDFTTLCRRRNVLYDTIDAIQARTGETLGAEEIIKIRQRLQDSGHEVNCGPCYVDSRRINMKTALDKARETLDPKYRDQILTQAGRDRLQSEDPKQYALLTKAFAGTQIKVPSGRVAYAGEILSLPQAAVDRFNRYSGLRSQSWSDFEVPHLLDKMQAVYDMAARKLKGHAYTKEIDYVETMKDTGEAINMSLIPQGTGFDANGKLRFNKSESVRDMARAQEIRKKYDNVGFEAIGISDKHIEALLANPAIDYVIPYHASGLRREYQHIGKMKDWSDYTDSAHWTDAKTGKPVGVEREIFVDEWKGDLKKLDKLAKERGVVPPFQQFRKMKGYEKLLVDRRIWGKDGKFIEQQPVQFKFDMDKVHKMIGSYKGEQRTGVQSVVDEFTPKGGAKYSAEESKPYTPKAKAKFTEDQVAANAGRTAIARKGPSTHAKSIADEISGKSVIDWGSGRGTDMKFYEKSGASKVTGYDPNHNPERPSGMADVVTNTFVGNVLPPDMRRRMWMDAMNYAKEKLMVAVRAEKNMGGEPLFDGVLMGKAPEDGSLGTRTFQKFYTTDILVDELKKIFPAHDVKAGKVKGSGVVSAVVTRKNSKELYKNRGTRSYLTGFKPSSRRDMSPVGPNLLDQMKEEAAKRLKEE